MRIAVLFGTNLFVARQQAGMTQKELAAKVYTNQSNLSRLERGHRFPRLDLVVALADALGVQVRDLLYGIA
jgi:XRE family transcriptional regulator, fatty acid utilization regulator